MAAILKPNLTIEIASGVMVEFVLVLPGSFIMGDKTIRLTHERPEHLVHITRSFYLGRHPVTQRQWAAVMGHNPAQYQRDDRHPVELVSWENIVGKQPHEEKGFLNRLPIRSEYVFRLPTEAEWEYAAKGGHLATQPPADDDTAKQLALSADCYPSYAGGDDANAAAWQACNNYYTTFRSGFRQPNSLGIFGMSGNVWEWCQDDFDESVYTRRAQSSRETSNPLVDISSQHRVVRGGSWLNDPLFCHTAYAHNRHYALHARDRGFRLVLAPI